MYRDPLAGPIGW